MKQYKKIGLSVLAAILGVSCGGGGGGGGNTPPPAGSSLNGTVAAGAAIEGTVTVKDAAESGSKCTT